jgi:hypothetical protein
MKFASDYDQMREKPGEKGEGKKGKGKSRKAEDRQSGNQDIRGWGSGEQGIRRQRALEYPMSKCKFVPWCPFDRAQGMLCGYGPNTPAFDRKPYILSIKPPSLHSPPSPRLIQKNEKTKPIAGLWPEILSPKLSIRSPLGRNPK